jgi:hypothetical protein
MSLSEDIDYLYEDGQISIEAINKIQEFIRLLKEEFRINTKLPKEISEEIIDKLAGEKLI